MAITHAYRKALADKHLTTNQPPHIAAQQHNEAMQYINNIQNKIKKELDKLESEYEEQITKSDKPEYREAVERNYIHWRHVLVSVFEPLEDAKAHWKHHTGLTSDEPRHKGKY
ncbi:hypothetical protein RRK80_004699 [Salmonella enterica]|nr:hypothetical protein [Salmonella enterica]